MSSNISNGRRAEWARGVVALFAMLAMGLGLMARSAEAAPFAYVANASDGTVSVIDTGQTPPSVAATVAVGSDPLGVAVMPDGSHAYVANFKDGTVSVIATVTNTVVATITVGSSPRGVAVAPDGAHVYVTNLGTVSVIATATNTVVATVPLETGTVRSQGVAVSPDGLHAYVAYYTLKCIDFSTESSTQCHFVWRGTLAVIATATNTVVASVSLDTAVTSSSFVPPQGVAVTPDGTHVYVTINQFGSVWIIASNSVVARVTVGSNPLAVAFTPDGAHAYVANNGSNNVSVIATANNTVVATVPVGTAPAGIAASPDGKHVYVANANDGTVSVIDTTTNTVEAATIPVGTLPNGVAIVPPPPGIPFLAFNAVLNIAFGTAPNQDAFVLGSSFTLSSTAPAINPVTQAVALQIGTFAVTIPAGSFTKNHLGDFIFTGVINGVTLKAAIAPTGTLRYNFQASAQHASLTGTQNAVYVTLAMGGGSFSNSNSGATSVTAIFH